MRHYISYFILFLSLSAALPALAAGPKQQKGVPTHNMHTKSAYMPKKDKAPNMPKTSLFGAFFNTAAASKSTPMVGVQFTPSKNTSRPVSTKSHDVFAAPSAPSVAMPSVTTSNKLFRHTGATSTAAMTCGTTNTHSGKSILGKMSSEQKVRTLSGGTSADGLMSSGSTYSSKAAENGASTTVTISSGPRRSPKDPFLDEEEEEDVPVGPIPFAFMALLAGGYMFLRQRRREEINR